MTAFPGSPRLLRGGLVLLDPTRGTLQRTIVLQYNPDTLTRTLQVQGVGNESGDRLEALRLKGPPVETIKLDAELDAADQLETPEAHPTVTSLGIHAELAALETVVYPASAQVEAGTRLAAMGTLEIAPVESPLVLFVWSQARVLPVRITELTVTEEAFDPNLNPLRAKVGLGLRVMNVNDLRAGHKGAALFSAYHRHKERLAAMAGGSLSTLGLTSIP